MSPDPLFRSPEQRASDFDRDTTVDILCAAVADGRLTLAELEGRVEAALSARTLRELAALLADLISISREPPIAPRVPPIAPRVPPVPSGEPPISSREARISSRDAPGSSQDRWALLRFVLAGAE